MSSPVLGKTSDTYEIAEALTGVKVGLHDGWFMEGNQLILVKAWAELEPIRLDRIYPIQRSMIKFLGYFLEIWLKFSSCSNKSNEF